MTLDSPAAPAIIAPQRVVKLHYRLFDASETAIVLDDSRQRDNPLEYLHGHGNILPGLERALEGRSVGASLDVILAPEDGYGPRNPSLIREVSRGAFPVANLTPGMRFQTQGDDGPEVVTILEAGTTQVRVDTNHPLAGLTLRYALEVLTIREATRAELAKGHPLPEGTEATEVEDRKLP
ncbi:FKBP-type peptidyl-prolyl cis-trans isomerase [Pistricoccus aurantiacus]|uniref:FKBP-type peptidyl-prolyl cis-trans isomerase n=1 Tax=Pistricoccus aurantiacus TaxID=1883414 RepID=UPI00362D02D2